MTTFGSSEVIAQAHISYRQLDYWTRCGYLGEYSRRPLSQSKKAVRDRELYPPRYGVYGSGVDRRYGPDALWRAKLLAEASRAGLDIQKVADAIQDRRYHTVGTITTIPLSEHAMVTIRMAQTLASTA